MARWQKSLTSHLASGLASDDHVAAPLSSSSMVDGWTTAVGNWHTHTQRERERAHTGRQDRGQHPNKRKLIVKRRHRSGV